MGVRSLLIEVAVDVVGIVGVLVGDIDGGLVSDNSIDMVAEDGPEVCSSDHDVVLGEIIFDFLSFLPEG